MIKKLKSDDFNSKQNSPRTASINDQVLVGQRNIFVLNESIFLREKTMR